jgi:hypothetical protein
MRLNYMDWWRVERVVLKHEWKGIKSGVIKLVWYWCLRETYADYKKAAHLYNEGKWKISCD